MRRAWSDERRRVVLLHELAHVLRGDAVTHLLARTALALHWWNPLAWTVWREFLNERERATDDLVLGAGTMASDYASHLLEIARTMQARPASAAAGSRDGAALPVGRAPAGDSGSRTHAGSKGSRRRLAAAVLAIAMMAPLAAIRAQSQAEQNAPPAVDATILAANAQKNHQILDQAAVSYEQLRKFAEAKKLREASLALAEQVNGAQSAEYAAALVRLGDLARRYGTFKEADDYYLRALTLGDRPEVYPALMRLGLGSKDPEKSREYLERARLVGKNGNEIGAAMTWLARNQESDPAGPSYSDSMYRSAMAIESPDSAEQALTLELYTEFLNTTNRASESEATKARAQTIRKALVAAISLKTAADTAGVKVGGGVTPPSLASKVEPEYSDAARMAKYQGTVLLKVVVDTDGTAKNIELVRGLGYGLDEKAAQAIGLWKFKPGTRDGAPIAVQAQIEVNFRLL